MNNKIAEQKNDLYNRIEEQRDHFTNKFDEQKQFINQQIEANKGTFRKLQKNIEFVIDRFEKGDTINRSSF